MTDKDIFFFVLLLLYITITVIYYKIFFDYRWIHIPLYTIVTFGIFSIGLLYNKLEMQTKELVFPSNFYTIRPGDTLVVFEDKTRMEVYPYDGNLSQKNKKLLIVK